MRSRRFQLGLSQNELGAMLGVRFQQIQKYESGRNRISATTLYPLSIHLNVPITFFFKGLDGKPVLLGDRTGDFHELEA